jgi:hypothetical protein
MHKRPIIKFRPCLERLEEKVVLSSTATAHMAHAAHSVSDHLVYPPEGQKPYFGYLAFRITNPTPFNDYMPTPSGQVLVQSKQPVPGKVYNVLQVTVRNGTAQTFTASNSDFKVRFPGQKATFPILTGNEVWKPGQVYVFYVLSTKYYPLPDEAQDGFEFDLDGARSVGIPGPSGIYLRIKYNPATFPKTLDYIVQHGPGNQGGAGFKYGLPVTSINSFVSSKTRRPDFGGYF